MFSCIARIAPLSPTTPTNRTKYCSGNVPGGRQAKGIISSHPVCTAQNKYIDIEVGRRKITSNAMFVVERGSYHFRKEGIQWQSSGAIMQLNERNNNNNISNDTKDRETKNRKAKPEIYPVVWIKDTALAVVALPGPFGFGSWYGAVENLGDGNFGVERRSITWVVVSFSSTISQP